MKIYLAGGAVRDLLLGRPVTDRDYLVDHADQNSFQARYPTARLVGKSFPVFILNGSEYAWPRGGSIEADLTLRDLTVNAMLLDDNGELVAHPQALGDLQARILRPCSERSLPDDPLRAFRAARFAAQLPDFSPSPELLEGMRQVAASGGLDGLSAERVGREVVKALAAPKPSRFLAVLKSGGCLHPWFSELAACVDVPAGPPKYHDKDVFGHILDVMDRMAGDPLQAWMGMTHDLGKALTPRETWPSHHGHEKLGEAPARGLGRRLRMPAVYIEAGAVASAEHMRARAYPEMRPGARVDLLMRLEAKGLTTRVFRLEEADSHGRPTGLDLMSGEISRMARRDLRAIRKVKLPEDKKDLGEESGEILMQLRCEAIATHK